VSQKSTSRDLILATLHGRDFNSVAPFALSLKRTGYQGRVVMFVSRTSPATQDALRQNGIVVMPFHFSGKRDRQRLARLWPLWRWYFAGSASPAAKARLAHRVFHLRYRRYLLYAEYLQQHGADYDRILLADSTDVFFQADPFAWNFSPGAHFFLEETRNRIGHCNLHRLWLGCQFGQEFIEQHAEKTVSCSGTTFGDTASIREYLNLMIATIMTARNLAKISGGDQGIHNYLLIQKLPKKIIVHENRRGPVFTMGVMRATDFQTDAHGAVLNEAGEIPPVLHQYDRIQELKTRLHAGL
jgi:hypothetical protein